MPIFPMVLGVTAAGILVFGYARGGFWLGALAVFLIWWADNDRKRLSGRMREEELIAANAPELVGKDFVEAGAYILQAIDTFKSSTPAAAQQRFTEALAQEQAEWAGRGTPMPLWATLALLRKN
ncbi:hypothetical protein ACFS07_36600 [Undibacterium arcticum]